MSKYQVGDILRIRQWDDMANEYGCTPYGSIHCNFMFTREMRCMCGEIFTVKEITNDRYYSEEGIEGMYSISADMLEYVMEEELNINSTDVTNLEEFLSAFQIQV